MGQLLVEAKQYKEGAEMLRQASILATDDLTIREHLGLALYFAGEYRDAPLSGLPGHGLGIAYTEGKRLLDQHRLARLQHLLGDGCMGCGWGSHDHGVHDAEQRGHVARHEGARVLPRQSLSHFLVGVADRRKLAFGQAGDRADVIAPPGASADYADLQPLHR